MEKKRKPAANKRTGGKRPEKQLASRAQALLDTISQAQSLYIRNATPAKLFNDLLTNLLALTNSEYGFIGEVLHRPTGAPYLKTHAITNIAWDEETNALYKRAAPNLEFDNLETLFGAVIRTGEPVIANEPSRDPRRGGLPPGHPALRHFLGLPIHYGTALVGMVGIANRPEGYDQAVVAFLQPFLAACGGLVNAYRTEQARAQAEAELRENQERFRQVTETISEVFWLTDPNKNQMIYISPGYENIWGRSCESLYTAPQSWLEAIHPNDRSRVRDAALTRQMEGTYDETYRIVRPDGTIRWIHDRAFPVRNSTGAVHRIAGLAEDITKRVQAEEALRESERRFRLMADAAPVLIWMSGPDKLCTYFNKTWLDFTGRTMEQELGNGWAEGVHPEDFDRCLAIYVEAFDQRKPFQMEYRLRKADGSYGWILDSGVPRMQADGMFVGYIGACTDITEHKEIERALRASEVRHRQIVETAAEGIWVIDAAQTTTFVNRRTEEMLGYAPGEMTGRSLFEFMDDEGRAICEATIARGHQGIGEQHDFKFQRKDGRPLWTIVSTTPLFDDQGIYCGSLGMLTDITARRHLEEEFRQAQKMEAVGRLAGGIAHDFNNLLTVITGYNEALLRKLDAPHPLHRYAEEVGKAAQRAATLTSQLLAFSRQQVAQPRVLDLNDVVASMENLLRRLLGEHITLITLLDPALGHINADPSQLEQVIMNLAINARDAMPEGGTITLTTAEVAFSSPEAAPQHVALPPGSYVTLSVRDEGIGMDTATQGLIFDPFYTTKEQGKGTGLGLAMVYGIAKQSGGAITVQSAIGQGTTLTLYLPRAATKMVPHQNTQSTAPVKGGAETILVVEDEQDLQALVVEQLIEVGYQVLCARDGQEALRLCLTETTRIDLLLTDVVMPGLQGPDLAQQLRAQWPHLKVLFTSGYPGNYLSGDTIFANGNAFLQKPFTAKSLLEKVRAILDSTS